MVVLIVALVVLTIATAFDGWRAVAVPMLGILIAVMGILFVVLPLTTPETSAYFGLRRSRRIARVLGIATLSLGVAIAVIG